MASESRPLRLDVFDVGHGESLLLEFPNGHDFAVIDCHRTEADDYPKVLSRLLAAREASSVPIVVKFAALTHPDSDHVRGFGQLLGELRSRDIIVEQFWNCPLTLPWLQALGNNVLCPSDDEDYAELRELVKQVWLLTDNFVSRYREVQSLPPSDSWKWEGPVPVHIEFIAPSPRFKQSYSLQRLFQEAGDRRRLAQKYGAGSNINSVSLGFCVRYGNIRILLTGDMINEAWDVLLNREKVHDPRAHVFKVPHHGSVHSCFPNGEPLCKFVRIEESPMVAVISGGYRSGLPDERTLKSLHAHANETYVTGLGPEKLYELVLPLAHDERSPSAVSYAMGIRELVSSRLRCGGDISVDCYADGHWEVSQGTKRVDRRETTEARI